LGTRPIPTVDDITGEYFCGAASILTDGAAAGTVLPFVPGNGARHPAMTIMVVTSSITAGSLP
jgi:hypothetical protein